MDSLKQLLDLSVMKRALEMLKEEMERLETSKFDVSEFEKQIPLNDTGHNEYESELVSEAPDEKHAAAAAAAELDADEAFIEADKQHKLLFEAEKRNKLIFEAEREAEQKEREEQKKREAEIEQTARDAATAAEREKKELAEQTARDAATAAERETKLAEQTARDAAAEREKKELAAAKPPVTDPENLYVDPEDFWKDVLRQAS